MKIGFFGGTFNPPHKGHEKIIDYCSKLFDKILIFPNIISPHKLDSPPIDSIHRINMLELIIKNDNVAIDTYEIKSELSSYTDNTVKYLLNKYKGSTLFMIIGKDQFLNLHNWHNINFILNNTNILCFDRNGRTRTNHNVNKVSLNSNAEIVNFDFPVSSSVVREKIYKREQITDSFISIEVKEYIYEHNLYI